MKRICVGSNKAFMTNDSDVTFTAVKNGNVWISEGIAYNNPFEAFVDAERRNNGKDNKRAV